VPIGLVLLALAGIGPVIAWRKASKRNLRKNFALPGSVGAGVAVGFLILGVRDWMAVATFAIGAFVLTIIAREFWKGTKARARIQGEGLGPALINLVGRNRRRWGGYIVHAAIVVIFMAFAGSAFNQTVRQTANPGDTIRIASPFGHAYTLRYEGISTTQRVGNTVWQAVALLSVSREGEALGGYTTEKRQYQAIDMVATEVGIHSTFFEDLYMILADVPDLGGAISNDPGSQRVTFEILIKPLVSWIWYGGLLLTVGTLIALWPPPPRRMSGAEVASGGRRLEKTAAPG
ncbi:MAG: hypothetical protein GWM92_01010, partial [Gemmatimonadetes bacterium]|nr:hypothetical protein [Gemmatimonadota bacterium]NIR77032.1 hypothetical protein [Gemmatimonadota bacterium]NIT85561.1 hypothetical protein [Gemmatimonadota bacterium]NIU29391.1 hypothetical protein [Gemmatimonadota bacterium]NIU34447.1 hypothetical protein [Gemmatimonadota bacterium]